MLCAPWSQQSLRFGSTKRILRLQLLRQRPVRRTFATHTVPRSPVCFSVLHACGVLTGWKSAGRDAYGSRYPYGYPHSSYHSPGDHGPNRGRTPQLFHSRESPEDNFQRGNLISPRSGPRMDHVAHRHDERSRGDDRDIRRENPTRSTWENGDPVERTERTRAQRAAVPTPQCPPKSPDISPPESVSENRLREVSAAGRSFQPVVVRTPLQTLPRPCIAPGTAAPVVGMFVRSVQHRRCQSLRGVCRSNRRSPLPCVSCAVFVRSKLCWRFWLRSWWRTTAAWPWTSTARCMRTPAGPDGTLRSAGVPAVTRGVARG